VAIKDIRTLAGDLNRLKLFEEASQDTYPAWSGAASVMREAGSSRGAPGTISQWITEVKVDSDLEDELNKKVAKSSREGNDGKGIVLFSSLARLPTDIF
jgi:hypothetical protein